MRVPTAVTAVMLVCAAASGDVMIAPGGADQMTLASHRATENLFAAIQVGADWSLYLSTDRGASWAETHTYDGFLISGLDLAMQVQGDHVYVVTSVGGNLGGISSASIRRFSAATGALDTGWGTHIVASHDDRSIEEVSLVVAPSGSILVGLLYDTDYIMVRVASISAPSGWSNHDPGLGNAERGLDMTSTGPGSSQLFCMAYVGTDGRIYFIRLNDMWFYSDVEAITDDDAIDRVSVACNADHAILAWSFKDPASPYQGVRAIHGSDMGSSSLTWDLWPMWESGSTAYHDPLVGLSDGSSNAVIYEDAGAIRFRHHWGFGPSWPSGSDAVSGQTFTLGAGDTFAFEWVGDGYGIVYPASAGGVYFCRPLLFANGFDQGFTSAWSSTAQ